MSTQAKLNKLVATLKTELSYNYDNKEAFKKAGLSAMRALAKEMGFTESRVSFNPGGIAVSGDHYIYGMFSEGEGVMFTVSQGAFNNHAGYCRHIKGLTDYSGGANVWIEHKELTDVETLKAKLRDVARRRQRLFQ
jgi:hypothetical protein